MNNSISQFDSFGSTFSIVDKGKSFNPWTQTDLLRSAISVQMAKPSKEQQKLQKYYQEAQRDQQKYDRIRQRIKDKFFKIKSTGIQGAKKLPVAIEHSYHNIPGRQVKSRDVSPLLSRTSFITSNTDKLSIELTKAIQNSYDERSKSKYKVRSRSQMDRKFEDNLNEQRALINKFLKRNSSNEVASANLCDLSNVQKYNINFSEYQKKKTKSSIEKDIQMRRTNNKSNKMEKFQDFILEEVKFSHENKEKIQKFFQQVRRQFKRADGKRDQIMAKKRQPESMKLF